MYPPKFEVIKANFCSTVWFFTLKLFYGKKQLTIECTKGVQWIFCTRSEVRQFLQKLFLISKICPFRFLVNNNNLIVTNNNYNLPIPLAICGLSLQLLKLTIHMSFYLFVDSRNCSGLRGFRKTVADSASLIFFRLILSSTIL